MYELIRLYKRYMTSETADVSAKEMAVAINTKAKELGSTPRRVLRNIQQCMYGTHETTKLYLNQPVEA